MLELALKKMDLKIRLDLDDLVAVPTFGGGANNNGVLQTAGLLLLKLRIIKRSLHSFLDPRDSHSFYNSEVPHLEEWSLL